MFSVIIPTLQKNINVLNKLVEELDLDDVIGEILIIDNALKGFSGHSPKIKVFIPQTNLFVNPSYVESYSLVNAEAMYLGVPTISAFAGAMGELGVDNESVLYYPRHDYRMCAFQIERLLKDSELSVQLSKEAICKGEIRNNFQNVVDNQVSIYNNILLNK